MTHPFSRRTLLGAAAIGATFPVLDMTAQSTPIAREVVDELVIDLPSEPVNIHPARAYSDIEWSIVHSVFDALIGFDSEGTLRPIAAKRFDLVDDVTWEVSLRPGMLFHDGSAVTSASIVRGFDLISGSDSQVSDVFGVIESVDEVDDLTASITVSAPSPWLPAQMAAWHVLVPEEFNSEQPVGSGPYAFDEWTRGEGISLRRHGDYTPAAAKGVAIAETVTYHFVPEATTRSSNLLSGSTDIASFLPVDVIAAIDGDGIELKTTAVAGSWFIRIANDAAPFDDARVRQALNLALDLDAFVGTLVHEGSERLATIYPGPVAMGFDPDLAPYTYDPDTAKALLEEAGYGDGIQARMEISSKESQPVSEAIIAQWAEVGVKVELVVSDMGSFNATWTDPEAPELRMATWSPLFDPSTLLNLVFWSDGVLSRYNNPTADELIAEGGSLLEKTEREEAYRALGNELHTDAAAVFLWNLVNVAGVSERAAAWTPRPDQWLLALAR